jgi:hypothetical protein
MEIGCSVIHLFYFSERAVFYHISMYIAIVTLLDTEL